MLQAESETLIDCPLDVVFRFVAENFVLNYPRWSPEVRTLEAVTDGPFQVGWIGRQVRFDHDQWSDTQFQVIVFEPGRQLTLEGIAERYRIDYRFASIQTRTRISFSFALEISPTLQPFVPLVQQAIQNTADRMTDNLKWLIEEELTPPASGTPDGR
jgi:hypothetical protein